MSYRPTSQRPLREWKMLRVANRTHLTFLECSYALGMIKIDEWMSLRSLAMKGQLQ